MHGDKFGDFVRGYLGLKVTFPQVQYSRNLSQLKEVKQKLQELTELSLFFYSFSQMARRKFCV